MIIFPNQTSLVPVSLEKRTVDSKQANKVVNKHVRSRIKYEAT